MNNTMASIDLLKNIYYIYRMDVSEQISMDGVDTVCKSQKIPTRTRLWAGKDKSRLYERCSYER